MKEVYQILKEGRIPILLKLVLKQMKQPPASQEDKVMWHDPKPCTGHAVRLCSVTKGAQGRK